MTTLHVAAPPPSGLLARQLLSGEAFSANTADPSPAPVRIASGGVVLWYTVSTSKETLGAFVARRAKAKALDHRFSELAARWQKETRLKSRASDIVMNDAYQRIMAMGPQVLPLIFQTMRKEGNQPLYWFWALEHLTDAKIVESENDRGDSVKMREHWLKWADDNGYAV